MPGEPPKNTGISNKPWFRQYFGSDMLFPLILLALEKEKPCKNFTMLCLFLKDITY
jgi:hypothetical protein